MIFLEINPIASAGSLPLAKLRLAAFRAGLARRGWSEGRNVRMDYRFTGGSASSPNENVN
jgi:hypothetical protein